EAFAIRIECHDRAIRDRGRCPSGGDVPDPRFILMLFLTSTLRGTPPPHGRNASTVGAERGPLEGDVLFVEAEQLLAVQIPDGEAAPCLSLSPHAGHDQTHGAGGISEAVSAGAPCHGALAPSRLGGRRGSFGKR